MNLVEVTRRFVTWRVSLAGLAGVILAFLPVLPVARFVPFLVASGAITAMMVVSLNIVLGYAGLLSLVHAGLFMVGGYLSAILTLDAGLSVWAALPLAIVGTVVVGLAIALVSLRTQSMHFAIVTLAMNLILIETVRQLAIAGKSQGLFGVPRPVIGGAAATDTQMYYLVLVALGVVVLLQRNLTKSNEGRAYMAVRESPVSAAAIGVPVYATQARAFAYSSAIAGLSGGLFAHLNGFVVYTLGDLRSAIDAMLGLFLGGSGTVFGPVLGTGLLVAIRQSLAQFAERQALLVGLLLLASIVIIPGGLVGTWRRRFGTVSVPLAVEDAAEDDHAVQRTVEALTVRSAEIPEPGVPALRARNVAKHFGGVSALNGVDLEVWSGSIHGLIGPNGSGKSTFCNCVTRLEKLDAGEFELFGRPLPATPVKVAQAGVIRVFQVPHLFLDVSVADNIMTGMFMHAAQPGPAAVLRSRAFRVSENRLRERAADLLHMAGLEHLAPVQAGSLPHGQQRLVEVLRAVAAGPRLLLLDEPATGLTSMETEHLATLIRRLRDAGITILLIEHNLGLIEELCDTVSVFDGGEKIGEGTPAQVRASKEVRRAYLGTET